MLPVTVRQNDGPLSRLTPGMPSLVIRRVDALSLGCLPGARRWRPFVSLAGREFPACCPAQVLYHNCLCFSRIEYWAARRRAWRNQHTND